MGKRSIGYVIREIRRKLNITQAALASAIGCTRQTVINWETGKTTPSRYDVTRLSSALGCNELDLKGDE